MSIHHPTLADGRWSSMPIVEQLANIGSEVERTLGWKAKGQTEKCRLAFDRALELFDLTLASTRNVARLREVARARDEFCDLVLETGEYATDEATVRRYYLQFALSARKGR